MTPTELRDLLEQVETHGGPLAAHNHEQHKYWLVGVLKRDLRAKDIEWEVAFYPGDPEHDYNMAIHTGKATYSASGMSELEAVINAWLLAAKDGAWANE